VTFHGDPAAGCARWGVCGYSGTVSWQPPPTAEIDIDRTAGSHPQVSVNLVPVLNAGPQTPSGVTSASVTLDGGQSRPASRCLDANQSGQVASLVVRHGRVTFSLARESPALLLTRCAGPRDADVLPRLPTPSVSVTALKHGRSTVSLVGSRPLASHGFTGSITSTLVLHIGRSGKPRTEGNTAPRHGRAGRQINVTYRATLSGTIVEEVRGAADPLVCRALGSCGLTGTITLTPPAAATTAHLTVDARATTPRRELLAAAGLGPGSPGPVRGFGFLGGRAGGTLVANLRQGSEHCVDTGRPGALQLIIATGAGRWGVSMFPGEAIGGPGSSGSRCPGPTALSDTIGSSRASLSSLDARTARIAVTIPATVHDDGYRVRIVPHLMLTLTRVKVRMKAIRIQPGELLP
jgi:hypothetical protein